MKQITNKNISIWKNALNLQIKRGFAVSLFVLLIFSASQAIFAAPSDIDFSFGSKVVDGAIKKSIVQPDGKIMLVGSFETFTDQPTVGIIRLNADGTRDASFDVSYQKTLFENLPSEIILQPDGKILVIGRFYYGGSNLSYRGIARLNSNGTRDTTFTSRVDNQFVDSAALQTDGKIIIGGMFSSVGGQVRSGVARINADGTLDTTFINPVVDNNNFGYNINKIALQPDGKIIIAGRFDTVGGQTRKNAARLNADGSLDTTFQNPAIGENSNGFAVNALALQSNGKIIIGGQFLTVAGQTRPIARLNADGSLDTTFLNTAFTGLAFGSPTVSQILVQADGKVYVEGEFNAVAGSARNRKARLNADGSLDTSFNLDAVRGIQNITLQTNGRLLAIGNLVAPPIKGGDVDFFHVREIALDGLVNSIVLQPDNKILIGGEFTTVGGYNTTNGFNRNYIARLNADGTTDTTFNPNILSTLTSNGNTVGNVVKLALQTDGKIVIAGSFTSIDGQTRSKLARLNANGSLDTTFQQINIGTSASGNLIYALAIQADGKILISGSFTSVNGNSAQSLARLNADGTFDATFQNPLVGNTNAFVSILPLANGKILIGGTFSFVNQQFTSIARLNNNGTIDQTFQIPAVKTGTNAGRVTVLITQPSDDKILIAGNFDSVAGQTRKGLARLNSDGTLDTSFQDPNIPSTSGASDLAIQKDGKIVIVGLFNSAGGQARNGTARINADGTLDTTFNDITAAPKAVAIQKDGKILIGGNFDFVSQRKQPYISRLLGTPILVNLHVPFDFDGDGRADYSVFRSGTWYIQSGNTGNYYGVQFGLSTDKLVPADYDGDGRTDIAVWREDAFASFIILQSSTNTVRFEQFGQTGDNPMVVGDFDGDGRADPAVYRAAQAAGGQSYFFYRPSTQPAVSFTSIYWGTNGDLPVRGDFDGDGRTDAAVFRPSNQAWYIRRSSDSSFQSVNWGFTGDKRIAADFDGDGKTDFCVFRPSDGVWYILQSSNNQPRYQAWGAGTDTPVAADYDGDGKTDFAVWRNGVYYILNGATGQITYQTFGTAGDVPIASVFNP